MSSMSNFTDPPSQKPPCLRTMDQLFCLGKPCEFLFLSQLNDSGTYQSTMRRACGYKDASSSSPTMFSSRNSSRVRWWVESWRWASACFLIMAQCWRVRSAIGTRSMNAFVPQGLSRKPWARAPVLPSVFPSRL